MILVCAFPYVIAFTSNSMEIRLIVNGNLVHTMTMPQLQLVASKNDIFFATTAPEFFPNNRGDKLFVDVRQHDQQRYTPPSSPNGKEEQNNVFLFYCLKVCDDQIAPFQKLNPCESTAYPSIVSAGQ